jgi:mannose-6-phosphate isomerase-like protein (cupin superfamily)
MKLHRMAVIAAGVAVALTASLTATASHSWNNYHWARNTSSFTLQVIDSTVPSWDDELNLALSQWSQSTKLDLVVTSYDDSSRTRKRCPAVAGKVRVCDASYGNNGWLGLASINLDSNGHITRGTAKMNDSYSSYFASQDERRHVMCQEIGHTFGLGHTSEDGSSQKTCMDYSQDPQSTAPNQHDYDQLVAIYSHTDSYNSYAIGSASTTTKGQSAMAGQVPMGMRVRKGVFDEMWVAPDGAGGIWVHHVTLAPGYEHTELLGN